MSILDFFIMRGDRKKWKEKKQEVLEEQEILQQ